jgi:Periplasmic binding protein
VGDVENEVDQTRSGGGSARYWPVAVVLVVIAGIVAFGVIGSDDSGESADGDTSDATEPSDEAEAATDDIAAWEELDPMAAPDCDTETERIMVPSVYAPNCVAIWPDGADNGGASSPGVTADEIVVAVYEGQDTDAVAGATDALGIDEITPEEVADNRDKMLGAYEAMFETYGRSIRWELVEGTGGAGDEVAARADAIKAAEEVGAFAVIGGPSGTTAFADELAGRGVICFCTSNQPQEMYDGWSPYVWSGTMASTQGYELIAEYLEERLDDQPAEFAGDPALASQTRSFGLIWYETADGSYQSGTDHFLDLVAERDLNVVTNISYIFGDGGNLEEDAATIVARLKDAGVTSVLFGGDPYMPIYLTQQATAQDYHPEWVMTGFTWLDVPQFARQYDQEQWANAFGLSLLLPPIDPEWTQQQGNLVTWHLGEELSSYPDIYDWGRFYTAIHLAGPVLTPETFKDGLFSFKPVSGFQTEFAVSYGEGLWPWPDHQGADDVTEIWWDPDERDMRAENDEVFGMYRYMNEAERYLPGGMGDLGGTLFSEEGTIVMFDERPDGDRPPIYPPRSGRDG